MWPDDDLVCAGGDLEAGTLLAAYRQGLFPMPLDDDVLGWWSPEPRGVIPLEGLHVSRSLRRSMPRFEIRVDEAFDDVVSACADPTRPHGWITEGFRAAYGELHRLGWAHSVEVRERDDGVLAGGVYGVAIGGFFAGESMFHHRTDASKAALVGLVEILAAGGDDGRRLLDVQWATPHLARLGAVAIPRAAYLGRLGDALTLALPEGFAVPR